MGTVYAALDQSTGKAVALKRLHREATDNLLAFRREYHTLASLSHPRIVEVYSYLEGSDGAYYTMELLSGADLRDAGVLDVASVCRALRDTCSALAFLHARRLVHRDVSPRNVRRTESGDAKLIDFGVLATVGASTDIAGTPPFIPPEVLGGQPLDPRVDLYAVGCLAYFLLTGFHAFPARSLGDLPEAWAKRPQPPSARARGEVSPALDELVLALLSHDPLARPSSAAEVMARLAAIADLEIPKELDVARGYLASAALVGRRAEMHRLDRALARARRGESTSVVIEAPSGTGKSRLLRELALRAEVSGATCAVVDASVARGPYAVLRAVTKELLGACEEDVTSLPSEVSSVASHVLPELHEKLGSRPLAAMDGDPSEDRLRVQESLKSLVLGVARRRPIAILVDDVQRGDEASLSVLASIMRDHGASQLVIAVARRTDEEARAPAAIASLVGASERVRLRGLEAADVEALVASLFGAVEHGRRLAEFLHARGGGSPLFCTELAKHLVESGVIRYVDGLWVFPRDFEGVISPAGLGEALDQRVSALPAAVRALGETLSVLGQAFSLSTCVALAGAPDDEVFGLLAALVAEEVLVFEGTSYRFRHDGLREAFLRQLGPDRRRALHGAVAEHLSRGAGASSPELAAEIGYHLLAADQPARAAPLLEEAGIRLHDAQSMKDALAPLAAALEAHEASGAPPRDRLRTRERLAVAGALNDHAIAAHHAPIGMEEAWRWAGLDVATRLAPFFGRTLGFIAGLGVAACRFVFTSSARRGPPPMQAMASVITLSFVCSVVYSHTFDFVPFKALVARLRALEVFERRVGYACVQICRSLLEVPLGLRPSVLRRLAITAEILERDHLTPLNETDRRHARASAFNISAWVLMVDQDPTFEEALAPIDRLGLRSFDLSSDVVRLMYHRLRGEERRAQDYLERIDAALVQLGSSWIWEGVLTWYSTVAYAVTRDVAGLRRSIEATTLLAGRGYLVEEVLALARGEYQRERGDAEGAHRILTSLLADLERPSMFYGQALAALAETELARGQLDDAVRIALAGIEVARDPEEGGRCLEARCVRALGLALAAQGRVDESIRELDAMIERTRHLASPSIGGALHEARSRVALESGDDAAYRFHLEAMRELVAPTHNPALLVRLERLQALREARATGASVVGKDAVTIAVADPSAVVSRVLGACRSPQERFTRALELLVEASGAAGGHLFLVRSGSPELVAPSGLDAPSDLLSVVAAVCAAPASELPSGLSVAWLTDRETRLGCVVLREGSSPLLSCDPRLVDELARSLDREGDLRSVND